MSTLEVLSNPTRNEFLQGLEKLGPEDFEAVKERVLQIDAQRKAASPGEKEAHLLTKIRSELASEIWQEYDGLTAKRKAGTLTAEEHKRLVELTDVVEIWNAERIGYLIELAKMRQKPVQETMRELGISLPDHV